MGKIYKGQIASVNEKTARVLPLDIDATSTKIITIPWHLRGETGKLKKGDEVVYVEFEDTSGLLLGRADGEWGEYLPRLEADSVEADGVHLEDLEGGGGGGGSEEANKTAEEAKAAAETAVNTSNEAKETAGKAQTAANEAKETAGEAQTAANDAKSTAGKAQAAANEAKKTAGEAQTVANEAKLTVNEAKAAAERAKSSANEAIETAGNAAAAATKALTKTDVAFSRLSKEFAVGATADELSTATEWAAATAPSGFNARQRACCYGNGYYVIAGTSGQIAYSKNGADWVLGEAFTSGVITGLAYGNGRFLAVDSLGGIFFAPTPADTWENVFTATVIIESIRYLNNSFVAVGESGFFAVSKEGKEWLQIPAFTANTLIDSTCGDGYYIAVGASGTIFRSINLEEWQDCSLTDFGDIRTALFANGGFVVGGKSGNIAYSYDGESWEMATSSSASTVSWIRAFAYAETRLFAVMYTSNGKGEIWLSEDGGATWTVAYEAAGRLWCISYGDGIFFTSGDSGAIYTLDLGIEWQTTEPEEGESIWYRFTVTLSNGDKLVSESYKGGSGGSGGESGSGDMLKSDYDTDNDGVIEKALADKDGNKIDETYLKKSGGTMTGELVVDGGDAVGGSKIVLVPGKGQITNNGTATLFGFGNETDLLLGHANYYLKIRGKASRPTYNGNEIALKSDIPENSEAPDNYVDLDSEQTITGRKTFNAPANVAGSEQVTTIFETANGGRILVGKEGTNSGTMLLFEQSKGITRLRFRASATAGAMIWEQPEAGAQLYVDLGAKDKDYRRITFPASGGTLALTSQIKTKTSQLENDSGFLTQHQDISGKANAADIAATKYAAASNSAAIYVKISDFGAWGTGSWTSKGFSMLITSRAGETVLVNVSSDDSNTNAKAIRLLNTYSKIAALYYSASESAIYVKANAWCNNVCAHLLTNIIGDYVPAVAQASALASDAVEIPIVEFGAASSKTVIGNSKNALNLTGSATRPTYNSGELALLADLASYLATSGGLITGLLQAAAGLKVSGRVAGAGDDEGIVVGRASNNYAGLCLGEPSGVRSVMYLMPDNSAVWRHHNGSAQYDIKHPDKAGTIALTSDIPKITSGTSDLTAGSSSLATGAIYLVYE